ncbi:50S ribosomal protein L9 [Desulfobacca acetoxidans]|uniref:Large ribosomal subunit protein bL9 n=1 Tax=Desulfobacca acetoxidans (strain ATCC 700848 / DSM 11109 / ASRB2) TaxID=880072 RepID=F2NDS4_DESAR|nr:50S ribosomal protein L9 [Desulfobacca acetoxidans]AEB10421.1 50S ribosomal protein L9 [Desulfobacca acetoxidans DSM 11109]
MKVILIDEIPSLGTIGSIVDVTPGYGRNYLIPQGKALEATKGNLARFEQQRARLLAQHAKEIDQAKAMAARLEEITLTIQQRVGESERLYGSVTNVHIAEALAKLGLDIDRKKIDMPEPIKTLGVHEAVIKLHPEVRAAIKIEVQAENTAG